MKTKKTKQRRKLTPREKKLAEKFIPEEMATHKYRRDVAVAIGISRAVSQAAKERRRKNKIDAIINKYL